MSGFNECAAEVSRYLNTIDGVDPDIRARLLNHLANCVQGVTETSGPAIAPAAPVHATGATVAHVRPIQAQPPVASAQVNIAPKPPVISEINNNTVAAVPIASPPLQQQQSVSLVGGVPILPGKTASGEYAFVIPSNILAGGQLPSYVIPVYTGAVNSSPVASVASPAKSLGSPPVITTPPQMEAQKIDIQGISFPSDDLPKSQQENLKNNVPKAEINNNYLAENPPRAAEADEDVWRPW